jgi:hypothetical protein
LPGPDAYEEHPKEETKQHHCDTDNPTQTELKGEAAVWLVVAVFMFSGYVFAPGHQEPGKRETIRDVNSRV